MSKLIRLSIVLIAIYIAPLTAVAGEETNCLVKELDDVKKHCKKGDIITAVGTVHMVGRVCDFTKAIAFTTYNDEEYMFCVYRGDWRTLEMVLK